MPPAMDAPAETQHKKHSERGVMVLLQGFGRGRTHAKLQVPVEVIGSLAIREPCVLHHEGTRRDHQQERSGA